MPLAIIALSANLLSCSANSELPINELMSTPLPKDTQMTNETVINKTSKNIQTKVICNKEYFDKVTLPSMVLSGTDVFEKTEWQEAPLTIGSYSAEVGGATIRVVLTAVILNSKEQAVQANVPQMQGAVNVVRTYREPGMSVDSKSYEGLCAEGNRLYGNSVLLEFVNGGVLLWEGNAGNEFISNELFIFLTEQK